MASSLTVVPEIGIPLEIGDTKYVDLRERAIAACNTAIDLAEYGLDIEADENDREIAALLASTYAEDPEKASKALNNTRTAKMRPASLVLVGSILDEFGTNCVDNSLQIRHLVTNKLLLESENPDARVRLRALELLGKISDVGLFVEKREVTVTNASTEDIKAELKAKLSRLIEKDTAAGIAEAEYSVIDDVDDAFGDDDDEQ